MTSSPSAIWRALSRPYRPDRRNKGLEVVWDVAQGLVERQSRRTQSFLEKANRILALEADFARQSDARLREAAGQLRLRFRLGDDDEQDLHRAFAMVREVASRAIGEKPFPVQVAGALALQTGCVAQMATGEGKTLTATMPAVVAGWRGRGCHIVTVNDYLAGRDAEWMRRIYEFCGLAVASIQQGMGPAERRGAYAADVTYCTSKELTADFLRDQLILGRRKDLPSALLRGIADQTDPCGRLVLRGLECAIVDEADSVLIDEAVTPLIIAADAGNDEQADAYRQASELASQFLADTDYRIEMRLRDVELTASGKAKLALAAGRWGGIWSGHRRQEELVIQSLRAKEHFLPGRQYIVDNGKVVIVDESTGRLLPDRTWREGLHQAVEAKEKIPISPLKDTLARISFQRFFRLYPRLSGMTGTAEEATWELWQVYRMPTVAIPTNRPCIREQLPDRAFANRRAKWQAVVTEIRHIHGFGRPILVGVRNISDSEELSGLLTSEGLEHEVLNAVRHEHEAHIVAEAGQPGRITVATNMAGRGTDIKLGRDVAAGGGLHVIATERQLDRRVDRQLQGRAGRQGDPGSARIFVSLDDELPHRFAPCFTATLRRLYGQMEQEITGPLIHQLFSQAQHRAEKLARKQRKQVLRSDDWLEEFLGFTGGDF